MLTLVQMLAASAKSGHESRNFITSRYSLSGHLWGGVRRRGELEVRGEGGSGGRFARQRAQVRLAAQEAERHVQVEVRVVRARKTRHYQSRELAALE